MSNQPRQDVCASCGRFRKIRAHDWCDSCYVRWDRAGRPESGPPPVMTQPERTAAAIARLAARTAARIAAIREMDRQRLSTREIAWRLDVTSRTVERLRARIRRADAEVDRVMALLYPEEVAAA